MKINKRVKISLLAGWPFAALFGFMIGSSMFIVDPLYGITVGIFITILGVTGIASVAYAYHLSEEDYEN